MPITNIVIVLFILAMIYMGSIQGLFSSFLHMMLVIAAGAITFALWEPLTLGLLMKYIPVMAWAVGLLIPFAVILLILRMVTDKLVPANVHFVSIFNMAFGGACGFASGVLTAGIAVLGLSFLPFGNDMGGYAPYSIGSGGTIVQTDSKLWLPVNTIAAGFYSVLSQGAFSTRTPMAQYQPQLDVQGALVRLRGDNVSTVAAPDAVEVTGFYTQDAAALTSASPATALALGTDFKRPGYKLVLVDTNWSLAEGTYDSDQALRLPSTHIRLVTQTTSAEGQKTDMVAPLGFAKEEGEVRILYTYNADGVTAFGVDQSTRFAWVFLVPAEQQPQFLLARHLRLALPEGDKIERDAQKVLAMLGSPPVPEAEGDDDLANGDDRRGGRTTVGDRIGIRAGTYALDIEISNRLPVTISKNAISGLQLDDDMVISGNGTARKPTGNIGQRNRVNAFKVPSHKLMVRIRIEPDQAASLFGSARASAAALQPIFLKDKKGGQWFISAYVWKKESRDQNIYYDAYNPIKNAKQLPIGSLGSNDELYLYFSITKGTELVSYDIGTSTSQEFDPPLLVE